MPKRRRWEEELEELEERERAAKPNIAQLDEGKRAGMLEELQRAGGNRALQQVVGAQALQREAAPVAAAPKLTRPFMKVTTTASTATSYAGGETTTLKTPAEPIKGPSTVKGHEGEFELEENYELEAKSPRDKATGQATGQSQYSELKVVVRKSVGVTRLRHAFMNNEQLDIVIMSPIEDGVETITLTKAAVVGVKDLANGNVELRFVFEKVRWGAGEMETADDWKKSPA